MYQLVSAGLKAGLVLVVLILVGGISAAQVMTSSNYQIQSDSLNTGGGFSSSSNYQQESTVGEVGSGFSSSGSFELGAGFQQMQETYIAISPGGSVSLSPSIPGVAGGTATGSTSVTVTTDSLAGYELSIVTATTPAMTSDGASIADYVPSGGTADFTFDTGFADAHFGYSPEGTAIADRFRDSGSVCGSGSDTADRCWDGLSTTPTVIATEASPNHPTGTETTVKFQVGIGGSVVQAPGTYIATTTLTAVSL